MNFINYYDLKTLLKNRNGITIGVSAGSMNQANRIVYKDEYQNNKIIDYSGIGITRILIYPYFNVNSIDYLNEILEVEMLKRGISYEIRHTMLTNAKYEDNLGKNEFFREYLYVIKGNLWYIKIYLYKNKFNLKYNVFIKYNRIWNIIMFYTLYYNDLYQKDLWKCVD